MRTRTAPRQRVKPTDIVRRVSDTTLDLQPKLSLAFLIVIADQKYRAESVTNVSFTPNNGGIMVAYTNDGTSYQRWVSPEELTQDRSGLLQSLINEERARLARVEAANNPPNAGKYTAPIQDAPFERQYLSQDGVVPEVAGVPAVSQDNNLGHVEPPKTEE